MYVILTLFSWSPFLNWLGDRSTLSHTYTELLGLTGKMMIFLFHRKRE